LEKCRKCYFDEAKWLKKSLTVIGQVELPRFGGGNRSCGTKKKEPYPKMPPTNSNRGGGGKKDLAGRRPIIAGDRPDEKSRPRGEYAKIRKKNRKKPPIFS